MVKKKKQKSGIFGDFAPAMGMAGTSMGLGVFGGAMQPHIPAGMTNPFTSMGKSMTPFIPIATTMGGATMSLKGLKTLIKTTKKLEWS